MSLSYKILEKKREGSCRANVHIHKLNERHPIIIEKSKKGIRQIDRVIFAFIYNIGMDWY